MLKQNREDNATFSFEFIFSLEFLVSDGCTAVSVCVHRTMCLCECDTCIKCDNANDNYSTSALFIETRLTCTHTQTRITQRAGEL